MPQYNFSDIPDNQQRTAVIQDYIARIRCGSHSVQEQIELRKSLVKAALENPVGLV
jgi:hypothetical protein